MDTTAILANKGLITVPQLIADDGLRLVSPGETVKVLVGGLQTEDRLSMSEISVFPGIGPLPHMHPVDELFYVLDGDIEFFGMVDGRWTSILAHAGATLYIPPDVPHCFKGSGKTLARALVLMGPSRLDGFFLQVTEVTRKEDALARARALQLNPPDRSRYLALLEQYAIRPYDPSTPWKGASVDFRLPGESPNYVMLNDHAEFILRPTALSQTGVLKTVTLPGGGVPLHSHNFGEFFYVLDGEVTFEAQIGGARKTMLARPGQGVYVPDNAPHSYGNRGDKPTTMLVVTLGERGGDIEQIFREVGRPAKGAAELLERGGMQPDAETIAKLFESAARAGMNFSY
jgi:quercetin dioxygenase-like cupin family protein